MRGITKMLGLDGFDFETLGKQLVGGIDEYNRKLDLILENQSKIMFALNIAGPLDPKVIDAEPLEPQ